MPQRHYAVPVMILRKIYKIPLYSCNRLLIRRKTLTSEEEFEFWEEIETEQTAVNNTTVLSGVILCNLKKTKTLSRSAACQSL